MKTTFAALSLVLIGAAAVATIGASASDAPLPQGPTITVLADEPVSGNDKMHAVVAIVQWQPGGVSIRHYHAGDEYATVLEGAVEIDNVGEPPHIYHAGQAYHNKRGVVHVAKNANNGPSRLSVVLILDKGAPTQVPAN